MVILMVGLLFLTVGGYFGWVQWRLHKRIGVGNVLAKLTKQKYKRNAKIREGRYRQKTVRHFTAFEYTYSIDGKEYKTKGNVEKEPREIPRMATVVYIKNAPYHGQIPGCSTDISLLMALLGIGWGTLLVIIGLLLLIV